MSNCGENFDKIFAVAFDVFMFKKRMYASDFHLEIYIFSLYNNIHTLEYKKEDFLCPNLML